MKILKKILTVIISIVLWAVILLAALYAFTTLATRDNTNVSNIAGFTPMIVQTNSMSPTFDAGDLILVKKCDVSTLKEKDIVTFHTIINNEYALNTHRIIEIQDSDGIRSYTTKGDNNDIADTHIIADGDIVGKYVGRIPKMGSVMNILSSSTGFLVIIVLPMLLFFIYQVYHLIMVSINLKKAIAAEAAAEQAGKDEELERVRQELEEAKRLKAEAEAKLAQTEKASDTKEE
jgi:signal peptidase